MSWILLLTLSIVSEDSTSRVMVFPVTVERELVHLCFVPDGNKQVELLTSLDEDLHVVGYEDYGVECDRLRVCR